MSQVSNEIMQRLYRLEAMGTTVQKEAAMLRQELGAAHQPPVPRKGKHNTEIEAEAKMKYQKNQIKRKSK